MARKKGLGARVIARAAPRNGGARRFVERFLLGRTTGASGTLTDSDLRPLSQGSMPGLRRAVIRQLGALAVLGLFALLLRDRIAHLDLEDIIATLHQVSPHQWLAALAATTLSFWALGQYDAVLHRALGTGLPEAATRRAGATAIAISQTLGLGLVTGALVRWRMLPGLGLVEATRITAAVAVSFLAGWAVITATTLVMFPDALPGGALIGAAGLGAALAVAGMALIAPGVRFGKLVLRLPSLPVMMRILMLAALDTLAAAVALWVLVPHSLHIDFGLLFPAFLLALGGGFVSGTPGGVGPFELALVSLLPGEDPAPLLGAVLAWRMVYFALPAALGGITLALHRPTANATGRLVVPAATEFTPRIAALVEAAPRAELGLLRQGEHQVLLFEGARAGWMIGETQQALVGLLDPFGAKGPAQRLLGALRQEARSRGRVACLYKIGARQASKVRAAGWAIAPVAREAVLDLEGFSLDTPARAGLRRKLRKVQKAGVTVTEAPDRLPDADMAQLSAAWVTARGGERGFSMGRYDADYVAGQRVFFAHLEGVLVGYVSFHANAQEWVLDLMRPAADAPDGTMQALILAAVAQAQREGCPRLSLAALPPTGSCTRGPAAAIWRRAEGVPGAAGLAQFKASFAPRWERRYIAAPNTVTLLLAAADIARAIRRPAPLPGQTPRQIPAPRQH
jgi:phosphatidylglycerol lysyltransferase